MSFTIAQKKREMRKHIETYYAPALRREGYVSYKGEGFFWYKVENDILYKVCLPIFAVSPFVSIKVLFGAAPLFTWSVITPDILLRNWSFEMQASDVALFINSAYGEKIAELFLGPLPRRSYCYTEITHPNDDGMMISHLQSERCGAEALDDIVFPVFQRLKTAEDIFQWNKKNKTFLEFYREYRTDGVIRTEEEYLTHMSEYISGGVYKTTLPDYSCTFIDECLYFREEKYYPLALFYLKCELNQLPRHFLNEKIASEFAEKERHMRLLIQVLENGEFSLLDEEFARTHERMLAQIKKKLPDLIKE